MTGTDTTQAMAFFKITRLPTGGFVVKDGFHDNVFASTEINASLRYVRDRLAPDPFQSAPPTAPD